MDRLLTMTLLASLLPAAAPLGAQTDLSVEIGASRVGPPAGVDGESARFGVAGMRASHFEDDGTGMSLSLLFGHELGDGAGGDFVSGRVGAHLRSPWSPRWTGGMDFRLIAFDVQAPFPYRAVAVEGGPMTHVQLGPVGLEAALVGGLGRSRTELRRLLGTTSRVVSDELWRVGGTLEALLGSGALQLGLGGGVHDSPGGTYYSAGSRLVLAAGWAAAELRVDAWDSPTGTDFTGGLSLAIPISGWTVSSFLGRSEPDPLTLAEPGSGSAAVLLGRSLYRATGTTELGGVPYEVVSREGSMASVRLSMKAPAASGRVDVLGDFSLWEPVPMHRDGDLWVVELVVPEGTHHYGFLVDDEWYVPDETRDVVLDEWGRRSAILVIEGVE